MRKRLFELLMFGAVYFVDPELLILFWAYEAAIWYFSIQTKPVKSNGF
jgi:hypothetical protein